MRGSALNLIGGVLQSVAGFGTIYLLTRILGGAAGLGAFTTAVAAITLFGQLSHLGTGTGIVRFLSTGAESQADTDVRAVLRIGLVPVAVVSATAAVALYTQAEALAPFVSDADNQATVAQYLRWFAVMVPIISLIASLANGTRSFGTMRPAAINVNIVRPGLQVLGLLAIWRIGSSSTAATSLAYWLPFGVAAISLAYVLRRLVNRRQPDPSWVSGQELRVLAGRYWRFTFPRSIAGVFSTIIEWSDALFIAGLAGTAQAGIYTAATRLLVAGRTVQLAATNALRPQISRLLDDGRNADAQTTFELSSTWSIALAWPWFLSVFVFAEELLAVLSPAFAVAASPVRILCVGWLVGTAMGPVSAVLEMAGRSTWSMLDLGLAMIVNIALNLLLIPAYGLEGAAVAWSTSILVNNLLPAWQVRRATGLSPMGKTSRTVAGVAIGVFGIMGALATVTSTGRRSIVVVATWAIGAGLIYLVLLTRLVPQVNISTIARNSLGLRPRN